MLVADSLRNHCELVDVWLERLPQVDEFPLISHPRYFAHDESQYDTQYQIQPSDLQSGHGLIGMLRSIGAYFHGPALEIGCGTGVMSTGLVQAGAFPLTLITDPSPAFLKITARKLALASHTSPKPVLAVLDGNDVDRLPADTFMLIAMRSTLHHISDVQRFLAAASRALAPGGRLVCWEPCHEAMVTMGALACYMVPCLQAAGYALSPDEQEKIDYFVATMRYYCRRDIDKTDAEDKHTFRIDELMRDCRNVGLALDFMPNLELEQFTLTGKLNQWNTSFVKFFGSYLRYCVTFPAPLLAALEQHFLPRCQFLDDIGRSGTPVYTHGIFVARKD
jgi:ubiquinone/menaquinone biosynthesis C-methylase UbiE